MKASALGCYGQPLPVSPFLDGLARRSAVLEQCHTVHTKCVPSRASLLTAQYPHVNGHRTLELHVRPHEPNLVKSLRDAGYQTGIAGKNHVVDNETLPETFDVALKPDGGITPEPEASRMPRGSYWVGQDPLGLEGFRDHQVTHKACNWIENDRDSDRPFFLWLNWGSPHPPYGIPEPYYGYIDRSAIELPPEDDPQNKPAFQKVLRRVYGMERMTKDDWREVIGTYLDMCHFVDEQVRLIFKSLERAGLLEDTIVAIWSDHGDFAGEHQLPEKWDTCFYDCITRVPLILHVPGRFAGFRSNALVESIDLMPTLLDLAGVSPPLGLQGRSLLPLFEGEAEQHRDVVFCQGGQEPEMLEHVVPVEARPRPCEAYLLKQQALVDKPSINLRAKMIRDHHWKYTYRLDGCEELYDLNADPAEIDNLAARPEPPDQLDRMRRRMMHKLIEAETVEPHQSSVEA